MTDVLTEPLTEAALFELLSLECRVDVTGTLRYYDARGQLHRVYGPAVVHRDGSRSWYQNGWRHRIGAPAVERADGGRAWYQNGQRHRLDGPAIEYSDGSRAWWQNGQRHRLDGPAIEWAKGSKFWYINGKALTEAEWQRQVVSMGNV